MVDNRSEDHFDQCEQHDEIRPSLELLIERDNPMADAAKKTLEIL